MCRLFCFAAVGPYIFIIQHHLLKLIFPGLNVIHIQIKHDHCRLRIQSGMLCLYLLGEEKEKETHGFFFPHELRCFYCISVTETAVITHYTHSEEEYNLNVRGEVKWPSEEGSLQSGRRLSPLQRCISECRH